MVKSAIVSLSSPSGVVNTVPLRANAGDGGTWLTILKLSVATSLFQ